MLRIVAAIVALCAAAISTAHARPSPYPPVTQFEGDRYGAQAHLGPEVVRAIGCPPPACARKAAKVRYLYPTRKRPPVVRQKWRATPVPAARPVTSEAYRVEAPLSVLEGVKREVVQIIGGRPQGCPHRFCGCALALKIFGRIMPGLNLAVAWVHRFPRVPPAPSMVAARHGHAFQLLAHVRGNVWRVWDANSGRGRIRIHDRSIAGFIIVNPHRSTS